MGVEQLTNLGVPGVSLGIIVVVVRYFITAINNKDAYIRELIKDNNVRNDKKDEESRLYYAEVADKYEKMTNSYIAEGIKSRNEHIKILQDLTNCVRACPKRTNNNENL